MATIGQTAKEMKKLFEASMKDGAQDGEDLVPPSRQAFITNLEQACGVKTHYTRNGKKFKKFNAADRKVAVEDLDISAYGMEVAGHKWSTQFEQQFDRVVQSSRFESVGTPYMANQLPITCSLNDAYGVFLSVYTYMAEADESYIGDELHTVVEPILDRNGALVNGGNEAGRRTSVASTDVSGVDVGEGIIPPGMGQLLETLVHRNRARLNARQFSWTRDSVMFNRIQEDISQALDATRIVKYEEERKTLDVFLGVGSSLASSSSGNIGEPGTAMPVSIGGQEWYAYQNGVWGTPGGGTLNGGQSRGGFISNRFESNYANAIDSNGAGITQQVFAEVLAQRIANRDPFTQDVIPGSLKGDTIWVANDAAEIQLLTLLYQWFISQYGNTAAFSGAAFPTSPLTHSLYNFIRDQGVKIVKSQRAANRLTDVGVLTDNATPGTLVAQKLTFTPATDTYQTAGSILSAFVIGRPKECIGKLLLEPFQVEDFNVTGDMQMRGIAGLRKVSERSQTFYRKVPYQLSRAYA